MGPKTVYKGNVIGYDYSASAGTGVVLSCIRSAMDFITECTQIAADVFGYGEEDYAYEITHAPQGPYFGRYVYLGEEDTTR